MADTTTKTDNDQTNSRDFISRYKILDKLGAGGMGVVYKAHDPELDKTVAVKRILTSVASNEEILRFQREAKLLKDLRHPSIPEVYNFAISRDNEPYMVLEFIQGTNLQRLLEENKQLSIEKILDLMEQVINALAYTHAHSIIHRDIKPANIIITDTKNGDALSVKVIDFGLARIDSLTETGQDMTRTGHIIGSPPYMSPEQIRGESTDGRTDIYSLGCILYELVSGKPPYVGNSALNTIVMHIGEQPPPLTYLDPAWQILPDIERIVLKCLQKEPLERYQNISQLKEEIAWLKRTLEEHNENRSLDGRTLALSQYFVKKTKSSPLVMGIVASVLILTLVIGSIQVTRLALDALEGEQKREENIQSNRYIFDALGSRKWHKVKNKPGEYWMGPDALDIDFKKVQKLKHVRRIRIDGSTYITGKGLRYLSRVPLESIALDTEKLSDSGMHNLAGIKSLKEVRLINLSKITSGGLTYLKELPNLTRLELKACKIPKGTLPIISELDGLVSLGLHDSEDIEFDKLTLLAKLPNLSKIEIKGTGFEQRYMPNLLTLKNLRSLSISCEYVSVDSLKRLTNLQLYQLRISESQINDQELQDFGKLKSLSLLNLRHCPNLTQSGVEQLQKKLPKCKIEFNDVLLK